MAGGPLTPVLDSLLQELKTGVKERRGALQDHWIDIVGTSLSRQTKGTLRKDGTLCVWTEDSTLAYELGRKYQGTILRRAEKFLGEGLVKRVVFRVGEID